MTEHSNKKQNDLSPEKHHIMQIFSASPDWNKSSFYSLPLLKFSSDMHNFPPPVLALED